MIISPRNDRVLIAPIDLKSLSAGGIVLRGKLADIRLHGIVLAVGPGRVSPNGTLTPITQCYIGDKVIYGQVTTTVEDKLENGDTVHLVQSDAIVAVISGD